MGTGPSITGFNPGQGTQTDPETGLQAPAQGSFVEGDRPVGMEVGSQMVPTKFGTLMKILTPALQGGMIGWAGGKGTPGGGFNAAQNFFNQRRQMLMQYALLNRQIQNDQYRNGLEYARTQYELGHPYFTGRGSEPVPAVTADGRHVLIRPNPYTGKSEEVPGYAPVDKEGSGDWAVDFDRGVIVNKKTGTWRPLVKEGSGDSGPQETQTGLPGGLPTAPTPMQMAAQHAESEGREIVGPQTAKLPTGPNGSLSPTNGQTGGSGLPPSTKSTQARPVVRSSRDAKGNETDAVYDENPQSPTFGKVLSRLPSYRTGAANVTNDQRNAASSKAEAIAQRSLELAGNDADKAIETLNKSGVDPGIKAQIRHHIRDIAKGSGKKRKFALSADEEKAAGVSPTQNSFTDEDDDQ